MSLKIGDPNPPPTRRGHLWFDDNGCYWHLYRYFEAANLDRQEELVDLYGGREIDGYQLDRLEDELRAARDDAASKPDQWSVLTGWREHRSRENEIWKTVERNGLLELIEGFLGLIKFAREQNLKVIVSGD